MSAAGPFITPDFRKGDDIRGIRPELEKMRRDIQALKPIRSPKILPRTTSTGTIYDMVQSGAGSVLPFEISIGAGPTATFYPGTINQLLPSNYLTGVSLPSTGTRYVTLSCTANNGEITSAAFSADVTQPTSIQPYAGQPPVAFKVLIYVVVDLVSFRIWGSGNILATAAESFRLQKASPTAGQVPYDVYYTWGLTVS